MKFTSPQKLITALIILAPLSPGGFVAGSVPTTSVEKPELQQTLRCQASISAVTASGDGRKIAAVTSAGQLLIWGLGGLVPEWVASVKPFGLCSLSISNDTRLIATGGMTSVVPGEDAHSVRLWDARTGNVKKVMRGHSNYVGTILFADKGKTIISSSNDGVVLFWDTNTGMLKSRMAVGRDCCRMCLSEAHHEVAVGSSNGDVRLYSLLDRHLRRTFIGHAGHVYALAFSPDGRRLASGGLDGDVRIWSVDKPEPPERIEAHPGGVLAIAWSPQGELLTSGMDNRMRVWNPRPATLLTEMNTGEEPVASLWYSRRGSMLVSGGQDGTVQIWKIPRNSLGIRMTRHH